MADAGCTAPDTEAPDHPGPSWTRVFTIVSIVIAAVALAITVWSVGPHQLVSQLSSIGIGFAGVLAVEVLVTLCDSRAIYGFLGHGGRRCPPYLHVVRAQVTGRAINAVTPLGSLGEAAKATTLMERTSSRRAIAAVLHYNLAIIGVRLITIVVGAPVCALVLDLPHALAIGLYAGSLVSAMALIAGMLIVKRGTLVSLVDAGRAIHVLSKARADAWRARVKDIDRQPLRGGARSRSRWAPTGWIVLSRILTLGELWIVLRSVGYTAGPGTVAAIATAGSLIGAISSIVPMGLGISEGSNAALFAALGAPASLGVTMVIGQRITLIVYAIIGLVLMGASTAIDARGRRTTVPAPTASP
ncbi:MAG TPA: lysylphosphatidylglycerol synthase transmembrane domain-containing protein [Kofleriaceae bacterium]|nr:lysylphosphatidylglycerol synthase transmembrane domain-containing protein [Kofleriaceae bacterium]